MKFEAVESRQHQVLDLHREQPELTRADIATRLGISKQRISTILHEEATAQNQTSSVSRYTECASCLQPVPKQKQVSYTVRALRLEHPGKSLADIVAAVGVSTTHVRQILNTKPKSGLDFCPACGGHSSGSSSITVHQILQLRQDQPDWNQSEIAAHLGIARQRVSQVLLPRGLSRPSPPQKRKFCARCEQPCSQEATMCRSCYKELHNQKQVQLICFVCKKEFQRRLQDENNYRNHRRCSVRVVCSSKCKGELARQGDNALSRPS